MALFRRKRHEQVDPNERSPQLGLKYGDLMVLDQLRKAGADLRNPRHVLYYLYFKDRDAAEAASREAANRDFDVKVREPLPEYPDDWSLVCELHDKVLGFDDVRGNTDFFDALAETHGGVFDGWEASAH